MAMVSTRMSHLNELSKTAKTLDTKSVVYPIPSKLQRV